ncbi:MAG: family 5 extracellular solute-binding protein peptide/nickel transport system substrate-binding [Parcubacteria group bacterium]|nr:family 5 extracellular solute-binding protein peptide/nickel transport system substrate-binding [Parcubacteria group bacterium]
MTNPSPFRYLRSLTPGDRLITQILGGLVLLACIVALYGIELRFLIVMPAYGGSLTEGIAGAPRFVNPVLAISDTDRDLVALTYAGLMGHDSNGALVPILAQSYTVSPDGKVYTFVIRTNATFSDGTPVTASDIVYTVTKAQDPALRSPVLANWANIRAEAVDARTVRFTLPKAYAPFLEDTTLGVLPSHIWKGISDAEFAFSNYEVNAVGAGPFQISNIVRQKDGTIASYGLAAFKGYATGRPYLNGMRLVFFADQETLVEALRKGTVESGYGVATAHALHVPYNRVFGVFFNPATQPLFADASVRKALSIAIDRQTLIKDALGGYATPIIGPVPPGNGISSLPLPDASTRIADAHQILTDAKWKYSIASNTWSKGSQTLSVTITTSNVPELKAAAAAIQKDWQALGVPTSIELHDPASLTQDVIRPRTYSALLFGEVIGRAPDLYAFWSTAERADPGLNIADYSNKSADALLEKIRTTPQDTADLATLNTTIANDYPAAFTHAPDFVYSIPESLHGVRLNQIAAPSDRFDDVAHWYRDTELVWPWFAKMTSK